MIFSIHIKKQHISTLLPYPLRREQFIVGPPLWVPDSGQVQFIYQQRLVQDPATPFPFWARTWASAIALAAFLEREPDWTRDKTVLELGAGTGLPSFTIAAHAAKVWVSDQSPEAVALLEKNREALSLQQVQVMQLDWNALPDGLIADTILLSDINYAPGDFAVLLEAINRWLEGGSTVLLSTPQRMMAIPFVEALEKDCIRQQTETVQEPDGETDIRILVLHRKGSFIV